MSLPNPIDRHWSLREEILKAYFHVLLLSNVAHRFSVKLLYRFCRGELRFSSFRPNGNHWNSNILCGMDDQWLRQVRMDCALFEKCIGMALPRRLGSNEEGKEFNNTRV